EVGDHRRHHDLVVGGERGAALPLPLHLGRERADGRVVLALAGHREREAMADRRFAVLTIGAGRCAAGSTVAAAAAAAGLAGRGARAEVADVAGVAAGLVRRESAADDDAAVAMAGAELADLAHAADHVAARLARGEIERLELRVGPGGAKVLGSGAA